MSLKTGRNARRNNMSWTRDYPKAGVTEIRAIEWKVECFTGETLESLRKANISWVVTPEDWLWKNHKNFEFPSSIKKSIEVTARVAFPIKWAVCDFNSSGWYIDRLLDVDTNLNRLMSRNPGLTLDDFKAHIDVAGRVDNGHKLFEKDQNFFENLPSE